MKTFDMPKDPEDVADYSVDFSRVIKSGDTIATQTVTAIVGTCAIDADSASGQISIVRLSGGATGERYRFLVHVVTSDGEEFDQTCELKIASR